MENKQSYHVYSVELFSLDKLLTISIVNFILSNRR